MQVGCVKFRSVDGRLKEIDVGQICVGETGTGDVNFAHARAHQVHAIKTRAHNRCIAEIGLVHIGFYECAIFKLAGIKVSQTDIRVAQVDIQQLSERQIHQP